MSTDYGSHGTVPATNLRPWRSVADWANVVLGVYLLLSPIWTAAPVAWFVILGLLIVGAALRALSSTSASGAEWTQIIIGIITFLSPWIGGFALAVGAARTAWVVGIAVVALAMMAMRRTHDPKWRTG